MIGPVIPTPLQVIEGQLDPLVLTLIIQGKQGASKSALSNLAETAQQITVDYTLSDGHNAMSVGPVEIAAGVSVTIPAGAVWLVMA
jgi:hypothetical protein